MAKEDRTHTLREKAGPTDRQSPQPSLCLVLRADEPRAAPTRFWLTEVDAIVIGRGSAFETEVAEDEGVRTLRVRLPDRHLSTRHVRLFRLLDEWMVEDTGSKNGTLLNGAVCARAPLTDGDLVEVGFASILFEHAVRGVAADYAELAGGVLSTLSPSLAALYADVASVAESTLPVLLLGESGVGKEVVARALHQRSGRGGPFVAINCGVLTDGRADAALFGHRRGAFTGAVESRPGAVRSAEGGTLFLDEVGELTPSAQVSLLRVLQEREVVPIGEHRPVAVDVRFIAATNRDLAAAVEDGRFRNDLMARLAGLTVKLPPLRDRRVDIGLLVGALLERMGPQAGTMRFTTRAARALLRHDWPLNVRELEMCLAAAGRLAGFGEVDVQHLPEAVRESGRHAGEERRREDLAELLQAHGGNLAAVARALKTSRMQVHRLLKRFGLDSEAFRK